MKNEEKCCRCVMHPVHKHCQKVNSAGDYCADMTVLLGYYKCMDDWNDERRVSRLLLAKLLKPKVKRVTAKYPETASLIEKKLNQLTIAESAKNTPIDRVAKIFGEIMGEIFAYQDDFWKDDLYKVGFYLGKFIYLLDAYEDIEKDLKSGDYNPYLEMYENDQFEEQALQLMLLMMGECTDAFERLPLVENAEIMRNILYSGVWVRYEKVREKRKEEQN
jgi:hypothetical protein